MFVRSEILKRIHAVQVTLPAIPWVCKMKFFQLSPAPCAEGRSAAAAPWSCALSPSPLHCTSSFQPNMTRCLSSTGVFCLLLSRGRVVGSRATKPLALALCRANKSWHPVDHYWQPCMRWDEERSTVHSLFIYFIVGEAAGGLLTCILDISPSVTCSGMLKHMKPSLVSF